MHHRLNKQANLSKHTNDRYLDTPEKIAKISFLRKRALAAERMTLSLREKFHKLTQYNGDVLDKDLQSDLVSIMHENDNVIKSYPENSFIRIFWEEQLKAASLANMKQMRWHPLMIKFRLNIKLLSSSATVMHCEKNTEGNIYLNRLLTVESETFNRLAILVAKKSWLNK
jgi:hypothetical protein